MMLKNLRPSSSDRWMTCTSSAVLYDMYADEIAEQDSGEAAKRGNAIHEYAAAKLAEFFNVEYDGMENSGSGDLIDDSAIEIANNYIARVKKDLPFDAKVFIEKKLSHKKHEISGTPDFFAYSKSEWMIYIADLKTGFAHVDAADNNQLMMYAMLALNYCVKENFYPREARLSIYQPTIKNWKTVVVSVDDILKFEAMLSNTIKKIYKSPKFKVSDKGCKYCYFKSRCSVYAAENFKTLEKIRKKVNVNIKKLTDDEIVFSLNAQDQTQDFFKIVEKEAIKRIADGCKLDGYELGKIAKHLKWDDENDVISFLKSKGINDEDFIKKTLISPSKAKKIIEKLGAKVSDFAYRPEGETKLVKKDA